MKTKAKNHLKIGELPDLRMVAVDRLTFHEEHDEQRLLTLVERLGSEAVLKNPPIVAATREDGRFLILDGANRVTALIKFGFEHIPVQVIDLDDSRLTLSCWHHAIERFDRQHFLGGLERLEDIELVGNPAIDLPDEEGTISRGRQSAFLCDFAFNDGETLEVCADGLPVVDQVRRLKQITDLYLHTAFFDRVSYTDLDHLKRNYPEFRTLLMFREFSKDDILELVSSGVKLPAGITRVLLPKRALGLNIRLEFLKSGLTLEEKNHWLEEMIHRKVLDKAIRFYQEPTFVFDE